MTIPFFPYKLFFLYIEPAIAIGGALYTSLQPQKYLADLVPNSNISPSDLPKPVLMTIYQLSNMFLLFALNEHLVLSSTDNIKTWKRLVFGLLVADFGHFLSMSPLGLDTYWKYWEWDGMTCANMGLAYVATAIKLSFILGIGLSQPAVGSQGRAKKA